MTEPTLPPDSRQTVEAQQPPHSHSSHRNIKTSTFGGIVLAAVVAIYAFAQPVLNQRFGWQLPGIEDLTNDEATVASKPKNGLPAASQPTEALLEPAVIEVAAEATVEKPAPKSLLHGILSDQGNDRFLSPEGLLYVRGSQEGHRLKHLERHTVDVPDRPGSHGVFDGGMSGALATIDKAYRKAKAGANTSKKEEDGRTILTVDMGSRVGYIGGSDGRRRKNPMARRVRLVLEQNRVITAYPM
jgi:hypothetical protein